MNPMCTKRFGGVKKKSSRRNRHCNPTRSRKLWTPYREDKLLSENKSTLSLFKKEKDYEEQR